ncbi:MAG TPA: hypothetical protein VI248_14140 [Kineosporiaceae bacterium]
MTAPSVTPAGRRGQDPADLADQALAMAPARRWELSRVFVLRHAGMPFDWLEALAAPEDLLRAAERLLDAEDRLLEAVDRRATGPAAERLRAAIRALRVDPPPGADADPAWARCHRDWAGAVQAYLSAFEAADEDACDVLREVLSRAPVQEAIFLSNPQAYRNMLLPFLARREPLNARWRRARRQLYTYVQRFCAKNETVSFFGPMAYVRTVPDGALPDDGVRLRTDLPVRRRVFITHWAAREVAAAVGRDPRLRTVLPFRRTGVPLGAGVSSWLTEERWEEVLGADGADLRRIAEAAGVGLREAAVPVRALVASGFLEFGLPPQPYELEPLEVLAGALRRLPGAAAAEWAARVAALGDLLRTVEQTPFPDRVRAVDDLERAFTTLTERPARRGSGEVYADRAVFYEECSSPFGLEVSEQVAAGWAERVGTALELSAAHGAATQRRAVEQVTAVLDPGATLSLAEYSDRLRAAFEPGTSRFQTGHAPDHSAQLWPDVGRRLLQEAARLPGDRYALIDLCPATGDVTGLAGGELVLSRCHHHLLTAGWLGTMFTTTDAAYQAADPEAYQADDPDGFGTDAARWLAQHPNVVGLDVGRRNKGYYRFPGRQIVLRAPSGSDRSDGSLMWPGQVDVHIGPAQVRCTDPAGERIALYLPLSDYVKYPPYAALSHPQVVHATFTDASGAPEIRINGVVYQRPRRELDPAALTQRRPAARFLHLRRVSRALPTGADRFVFCRTESERKPYLVDLASVLAADLVAHIASDGSRVLAEQMRPAPDELWLRDAQGRRYTSELRVQAIGRATT